MEIKLTVFNDLTALEIYRILQLRQMVFGIEQRCLYLDLDDRDQHCWHLTIYDHNQLAGYARLIPSEVSYNNYVSFGRVVIHPAYRGTGLGKLLLGKIMSYMQLLFPGQSIKIGAQVYLIHYYQTVGFYPVGEVYPEDGIDHIAMIYDP